MSGRSGAVVARLPAPGHENGGDVRTTETCDIEFRWVFPARQDRVVVKRGETPTESDLPQGPVRLWADGIHAPFAGEPGAFGKGLSLAGALARVLSWRAGRTGAGLPTALPAQDQTLRCHIGLPSAMRYAAAAGCRERVELLVSWDG